RHRPYWVRKRVPSQQRCGRSGIGRAPMATCESLGGAVMMDLDYLSPYPIPSIKADGGQDVFMCEAFAAVGLDVRLLRSAPDGGGDLFAHYGVVRSFEAVDINVAKAVRALRLVARVP